jgi:hypothetical protein
LQQVFGTRALDLDPALEWPAGRIRQPPERFSVRGGCRHCSEQGAADFAIIRSFISTAKKHHWNIIQALLQDTQILIAVCRPT